MPQTVEEIEVRAKLDQVIGEMTKATNVTKGFTTQLKDVLDYLDKINNKSLGITKNANYFGNVTNNSKSVKIGASKHLDTYMYGDNIMQLPSGSQTKAAKDAQQAVIDGMRKQLELTQALIDKNKELTNQMSARTAIQQKYADTNAERLKEQQKINKENEKFRKYRNEHPELFISGGFRRSGRYQAASAIQGVSSTLSQFGTTGRIASSAGEVASAGLMYGAAGAGAIAISKLTQGIANLAKTATEAFENIDSLKVQLSVVFGNESQAAGMFTQISQYATKSPFGIEQTTELATLLRQSGVEASKLMDTLRMLGDTAGGNMEKMKRIANNYAQIVSIGKASMLDMRQFAYAGIPIFEKVSEELGVSQTRLRKMISEGKVTAEIVEKVFKDMTGINGIFENATEKGARTLKARVQNLKDIKTLAMSGMGESLNRFGETYGGDSLRMRQLDFAESFYEKIANIRTFKNLESSVFNIERATADEDKIRKQVEELEKKRNAGTATPRELEKLEDLKKTLGHIEAILNDPDKIRGDSARLYEMYLDFNKEIYDKIPELLTTTVEELRSEYEAAYKRQVTDEATLQTTTTFFGHEISYDFLNNTIRDVITHLEQELGLRPAYAESVVQQAQRNQSDLASEASKKSTSFANAANEMLAKYEETEEYKKKQQEEEKERLKKIYETLKDVAENKTDESGKIDFKKTSYEDLRNLIDNGGIDGRRALNVTNDNPALARADFATLIAQTNQRFTGAYKDALRIDSTDIKGFASAMDAFKKVLESSDIKYGLNTGLTENALKLYNNAFTNISNSITSALNDPNVAQQKKELLTNILDSLSQALVEWTPVKVGDYNFDELFSETAGKAEPSFQPLYKRILSGALGIPATAITGTGKAMEFYSGNIASRNMAGNVLGNIVRNGMMSVSDTTRFLTPNGKYVELTGDYKYNSETKKNEKVQTYQIDWEKVRKNIEDFSLQIRTSTEVIKSYKKSLEDQRDTYINLYQETMKAYETEGKSTAWVNAKWLERNGFLRSEEGVGVNAFGEKIYNENDELVTDIRNGIAYGMKDGKEYELSNQELHIAGNIFDLLNKYLQDIDKQLAEANKIEAKNAILENERNRALEGNALTYLKLSNFSNRDFIDRNSNSILSLYETRAKEYFGEDNYEAYNDKLAAGDSVASAIMRYLLGQVYTEISEMTPEQLEAFASQADRNRLGSEELSLKDKYDQMINKQSHYGLGANNGYITKKILSDLSWDKDTDLSALGDNLREIQENFSAEWLLQEMDKLSDSLDDIIAKSAQLAFTSPFETLGENIIPYIKELNAGTDALSVGKEYLSDWGESIRSIAGDLVKQTGQLIQQAGFSIVTASAMEHNWPGVAAGLGLAAAGGFASGFGSWLGNKNSSKDNDDQTKKLQSLTDQLRELLAQARADALYYEKNLRHKTALGLNEQFSYKSVNDAIITKKGDVIETSPEDYLIATKTPQALGNNTVVQPNINFNVIDNVGVQVRQEKRTNPDGSIDIVAVIENAVGEYIASSRSDDAFNTREYRLNGRTAIM